MVGSLELVSLELDTYAERIGEYFEKELGMPIRRVKFKRPGKSRNKYHQKAKVDEALGKGPERKLVLYGSGYYHHYTYGLCRHADRFSRDYAYMHFDHHDDSYKNGNNSIDCASFVIDILEDTNASAVSFIGSYDHADIPDAFPHQEFIEEDLRKEGCFEKLKSGLALLPRQVYMSFDLDVMPASLMRTDFCQGTLKLEELMKCISLIKESKDIIGADVLGYTGRNDRHPGREVYAEIVRSLLIGDKK